MKTFAGKHVVITGAASGIGRALAQRFAKAGAIVSLVDVDAAKLREAAAELGARSFQCDLGDPLAIEALSRSLDAGPAIDALVNNAGLAVIGPFHRCERAEVERMIEVNLLGAMRLTRAVLPSMCTRKTGHLVFVASYAGLVGAPAMVGYSASKFGVVGFAEALRYELASEGVAVTTVCPGYVRTNLHASTRYDNEGFKAYLDRAPASHGLSAEDVADAIVRAVARRKTLLVLGPEKVGWWLKRLSPELAHVVSKWVAERTGIASWSG